MDTDRHTQRRRRAPAGRPATIPTITQPEPFSWLELALGVLLGAAAVAVIVCTVALIVAVLS